MTRSNFSQRQPSWVAWTFLVFWKHTLTYIHNIIKLYNYFISWSSMNSVIHILSARWLILISRNLLLGWVILRIEMSPTTLLLTLELQILSISFIDLCLCCLFVYLIKKYLILQILCKLLIGLHLLYLLFFWQRSLCFACCFCVLDRCRFCVLI